MKQDDIQWKVKTGYARITPESTSEDVQSAIAVALGLESDYFSKSDEQVVVLPTAELRNGVIPRLDVEKAAKLLQMNHNTVRKGLQQGVFPCIACIIAIIIINLF